VVVTLDPNADKKFSLGKEVLTGLIGVLGTIVGFYFGTGKTEPTPSSSPPAIVVKQFKLEPEQVKPGDTFSVSATVTGAKGELEYVIDVSPESVSKEIVEPLKSSDIRASIRVPPSTSAGTIQVTLQVRKKGGGTAEGGEPMKGVVKVVP
jgi:hypothetical protein